MIIRLMMLLFLISPGEGWGEEIKMEILQQNLYQHVHTLSDKIGERSLIRYTRLEQAADYIQSHLGSLGYKVEEQIYRMQGRDYRNLIATLPGRNIPQEIILVGAHYDTVTGTPGADDNASGVAGLLELARLCKNMELARTLRFVAFSLEEPPVFNSRYMGSRVYARQARLDKQNIVAMLCLESIGYYSHKENSQEFPLPIMRFFYPNQGNFIAVVGNLSSWNLVNRVKDNLKESCQVPVETLISPSLVPGVDFSDHASFWKEGYPAVMITDSALYRNPYYHLPSDTIHTLDFDSLTAVVKGVFHTIRKLAGGHSPL
jgi:hypothetical protein